MYQISSNQYRKKKTENLIMVRNIQLNSHISLGINSNDKLLKTIKFRLKFF